jgi:hypothetical protein
MQIFLINGKAHIAVSNGFEPIPDQMYYMILEEGVEPQIEVYDYD